MIDKMLTEDNHADHNDPEERLAQAVKFKLKKGKKVYDNLFEEVKQEEKEKRDEQEKKAKEIGKNIHTKLAKVFNIKTSS